MSEVIQNALRVSDNYRAYANIVGGLSLMAFALLFLPDLTSLVESSINIPDIGGSFDFVALPIFLVCLFIVIGTMIRLSSYLVEEILGYFFPSFGYSYYYNQSKSWIETEYEKVFPDLSNIKNTNFIGTVDLLNTLKTFYREYDSSQYKVVQQHVFTLEMLRNVLGFIVFLFFYEIYKITFGNQSVEESWGVILLTVAAFVILARQFPRRVKKIVRNEIVLIRSAGQKYVNLQDSGSPPAPASTPSTARTAH